MVIRRGVTITKIKLKLKLKLGPALEPLAQVLFYCAKAVKKMEIPKYSGKQAREIIKNLTPKETASLTWEELVGLARAGQREIRNDIKRFRKAGVERGAFAIRAFRRATTEHDVTYSYYSIKERKYITKTKRIKPEITYMARINEKRSNTGLELYINKLQSYFSDSTGTNTIEGIKKNQRYIRFYMGGGEIIEDENGIPIDYIPKENFSDEEVDHFYDIYQAAKEMFGSDFAAKYQSIRDAIVYAFRNSGEGIPDFRDMTAQKAAEWLFENPNFVEDPSGTIGKDDAFA